MKIILIRGLPGSSKSTFARKMFPNNLILENDMMLYSDGEYKFSPNKVKYAIKFARYITEEYISHGADVVLCNTFIKKSAINNYKTLADMYGCDFIVYRMTGNFKNIHNVPNDVLENMKNNFEDYEGEEIVEPVDGGYVINGVKIT